VQCVLFYENEHVNLLIEKIRYQVYTTYFINQLTKPFFICLLFSEDILFSLCNRWGCRVLKKRHVVHINCQVSKLFRIGANYFCSFQFALGVYLLNFCFFCFLQPDNCQAPNWPEFLALPKRACEWPKTGHRHGRTSIYSRLSSMCGQRKSISICKTFLVHVLDEREPKSNFVHKIFSFPVPIHK